MSTDLPPSETPPEPRATYYDKPVWKRFYAFMLGPALVAAAALAIFTVVSVLTKDDLSPRDLVRGLRTGGQHQRWQSAFALTKYLQPSVRQKNDQLLRESDADYREKIDGVRMYLPELLEIYNDPQLADDQVRRFLALAFGYLGDPRVIPVLVESLRDEDIQLVHHALASIATTLDLADSPVAAKNLSETVAPAVMGAANRQEPDVRATAVYVLGLISEPKVVAQLEMALGDTAPAVRWNAAFALARQKNPAGEAAIAEILDRGALYQAVGADPARQEDLFLNAVRSAGMVRSPMLDERLARIAKSDENLRARDLAINLLKPATEG
ncbi:MAG: HEAT repeat domain-containing protein [Myxococcota bacterium]